MTTSERQGSVALQEAMNHEVCGLQKAVFVEADRANSEALDGRTVDMVQSLTVQEETLQTLFFNSEVIADAVDDVLEILRGEMNV